MREILFRGKRLDNGLWIEGCLRQYPSGSAKICDKEMQHTFKIDPATVGQYTGLTDIHGKKIFEGDIVKHYNFDTDPEEFSLGVILWNDESCRWERTASERSDRFFIGAVCKYEIIGNIHDNPELIKED